MKNKTIGIIFILCMLLIISCSTEPESVVTTEVTGYVYFSGTTVPISDVTVSIGNASATTSSDGSYELLGVDINEEEVVAEKEGYDLFRTEIFIPEFGRTLDIQMTSSLFSSTLFGTVRNTEGQAVDSAIVIVLNLDGTESDLKSYSSSSGVYEVQAVPLGNRNIIARKRGFEPYGTEISLSDSDYELDINMTEFTFLDVTNPVTGRIWADRNLGASRVATSATDSEALGDLYQWGRSADGHQKRNSATTDIRSRTNNPGHGDFITTVSGTNNWRSSLDDGLPWQGEGGINNPCPQGYRLPTKAEWEAEFQSWRSTNPEGAFSSQLKLPVTGSRWRVGGVLFDTGSVGHYWSADVSGDLAYSLNFFNNAAQVNTNPPADGKAVRCIKD